MKLIRFIDHVHGPLDGPSVLVGNGSRLVERTKRVHGHQVPLYLAFHDFTYTLEQSLPMDNHEIALEQQGGNAGASLRAKEEQELCLTIPLP